MSTPAPAAPPKRRPQQPLHEPSTEMVTYTLDRTQRWRQYGWIDHLGRMYDLGEDPKEYHVASYSPLWVLVDNEPAIQDDEPCPDCGNDSKDESLHADGCRRVDAGPLQFGPPWKPWPNEEQVVR